ncbi:MAG TPA: c-type cytochrome [Thermoanaerobaculia bacterium]|nr:c-type cytochrome [Thermoanaerobaculia bacterium]
MSLSGASGIYVMCHTMALLALFGTGCSTPVPIRFGAHHSPAPVVAFSNPRFDDGDAIAGRRAFIAMRCIDCHRVAGDTELPLGRRAIAGPLLSGLDRRTPVEVANRITSSKTGSDQELFDRTMKDYAQPMTARQLVDIVAYLRNPRMPRS